MGRNGWSPERRARQAAAIQRWAPWKKATGPKSVSGLEKSKMNALKHGGRSAAVRLLGRLLKAFSATDTSPRLGQE